MPSCIATKADGSRCRAGRARGSEYCWAHDPAHPEAPAERRKGSGPKPDPIAKAKEAGLSFKCAADVKAFMEQIAVDTRSGALPASACQPLNSICRTMLSTFFAGEDDLSQVPDALKALTGPELYEQMARAIPTPVLRKELASR